MFQPGVAKYAQRLRDVNDGVTQGLRLLDPEGVGETGSNRTQAQGGYGLAVNGGEVFWIGLKDRAVRERFEQATTKEVSFGSAVDERPAYHPLAP